MTVAMRPLLKSKPLLNAEQCETDGFVCGDRVQLFGVLNNVRKSALQSTMDAALARVIVLANDLLLPRNEKNERFLDAFRCCKSALDFQAKLFTVFIGEHIFQK